MCVHIAVYFGAYLVCLPRFFISIFNHTESDRLCTGIKYYSVFPPGGWGFFGSLQDHQSRYSFALCGEAEAAEVAQGLAGLLLDWPKSMDRKPKSTRRRVQVVEPGPKLKTIRSFPHR